MTWLRISSGIKSRSIDLNSWDTLYKLFFFTTVFFNTFSLTLKLIVFVWGTLVSDNKLSYKQHTAWC